MKAAGFKIPADAMAEIDKITGFHRFEASRGLTDLRLPPRERLLNAEIGIAGLGLGDGGFGVFVCSMTWLYPVKAAKRHELRGPLVAGHVRMLARLMVWQVDDVVCAGLCRVTRDGLDRRLPGPDRWRRLPYPWR